MGGFTAATGDAAGHVPEEDGVVAADDGDEDEDVTMGDDGVDDGWMVRLSNMSSGSDGGGGPDGY